MKINYLVKNLLSVIAFCLFSSQVFAEIVVVVNSDSDVSVLSKSEVKALYLGKNKSLKPYDQIAGTTIRKDFVEKVISKTEGQLKAYWSRRIFSGRGIPPKVLDNSTEIKARVKNSKGAIGYIDSSEVDSSVRVVYTVK